VDLQKAADLRQQVNVRDSSLNVPVLEEEGADRMALLVDPESLEGPVALKSLQRQGLRRILMDVLQTLPARERSIIVATQVSDPPATLEQLGIRYGISRERVRQLRERGLERLRTALRKRDFELDSFLHCPQRDYHATSVAHFCTAVLTTLVRYAIGDLVTGSLQRNTLVHTVQDSERTVSSRIWSSGNLRPRPKWVDVSLGVAAPSNWP
ncbi:MAG: sigma factor-like helix-turn-helix DNA-binding protein, partial [Proteobacteria bacterium]|nr:sigma factor-like helix-turn-helix DNA-binding protein [Pseudomonadota bacterium]